jgi:hypothetical protein
MHLIVGGSERVRRLMRWLQGTVPISAMGRERAVAAARDGGAAQVGRDKVAMGPAFELDDRTVCTGRHDDSSAWRGEPSASQP